MYFLEHFDEIVNSYKESIGVAEAFYEPKHHRFLADMKAMKAMFEEMKEKDQITEEDREKAATSYALIHKLFSEQTYSSTVKDRKYNDEGIRLQMRDENKAMLYLDTTSGKNLETAVDDAKKYVYMNQRKASTAEEASRSYMINSNQNNVKADLEEDNKLFGQLDESLANSKVSVHGTPSPQYVAMEEAYNAFKKLNNEMRSSEDYSEARIEQYRKSLLTLSRAAKAYEDYKLNNGAKTLKQIKTKEVRRVETARLFQKFANSRVKAITNSKERVELEERVNVKLQAYELKFENELSKMKKVDDKTFLMEKSAVRDQAGNFPSSDDFVHDVMKLLGVSAKSNNSRMAYVRNMIKGCYGDISTDRYFKDAGEQYLETGILPKTIEENKRFTGADFLKSADGAVENAKKNSPRAYERATLNAIEHFAKKLSAMDSIKPNFVFLTDLTKFAYESESKERQSKFSKKTMFTIRGIEEAGKIVREGMKSWNKMMAQNPEEIASYDPEDLKNLVAMRVLERGMKQFATMKDKQQINPMYYFLGSTENGRDALMAEIENSKMMQQILDLDVENQMNLLTNNSEKLDKAFAKLMVSSFNAAFYIPEEEPTVAAMGTAPMNENPMDENPKNEAPKNENPTMEGASATL